MANGIQMIWRRRTKQSTTLATLFPPETEECDVNHTAAAQDSGGRVFLFVSIAAGTTVPHRIVNEGIKGGVPAQIDERVPHDFARSPSIEGRTQGIGRVLISLGLREAVISFFSRRDFVENPSKAAAACLSCLPRLNSVALEPAHVYLDRDQYMGRWRHLPFGVWMCASS
ncbi:hypothetical protein CIRG_01196 [Coccidioides immitis RMSCC 2394]|uniref:Uncharacterized protein n=1 Tax=Coccidioides immitis RMSCC 2394 TaxID=404692 RepID=A0A0J6XXV5_COCIT|nr:hypothetical protein CIRG_01196 [Coccidioides immitis RMSCC 2394]